MKVDIYHERQESLLCGQHCLNNLLQDAIFSAITLADIAHDLDRQENDIVEGGFPSNESANVDDSGNFSVQVLRRALQGYNGCDLEPWFQRGGGEQDIDPLECKAFIINRESHWFTLRKIGDRWWNLNSTNEKPELISQFYLSAFIHGLRAEGYSVFIVSGNNLPAVGNKALYESISSFEFQQQNGQWYSEEELLGTGRGTGMQQHQQQQAPAEINPFAGTGRRLGGDIPPAAVSTPVDPRDFQIRDEGYDEEMMLARAISASLESASAYQQQSTATVASTTASPALSQKEEMRAKRLAALERRGV